VAARGPIDRCLDAMAQSGAVIVAFRGSGNWEDFCVMRGYGKDLVEAWGVSVGMV